MDVYRQAAEIISIVRAGNGTAKALCLRKEMQKKRQTYAVVCETLRHSELLDDVLAVAEFFKYYPQANREFALCMTYDVVLGKGVSTKNDSTARAVQESASYLREAYWQVHRHHIIPPRTDEKFEESVTAAEAAAGTAAHGGRSAVPSEGGSARAAPSVLRLPRYARVNTLKIDKDTLVARLQRAAAFHRGEAGGAGGSAGDGKSRKRGRDEGNEDSSAAGGAQTEKRSRRHITMPDFTEDSVVPSLLVFPHGTDLHAHPAVRSGQLVLQDRASCLPACVLLDAVKVVTPFTDGAEEQQRKPLEYVVDACAAPGNKTTQLAALGAPNIKLMAVERDERRAELLQRRVQTLGATDYVNVMNTDFLTLSSDDRAVTEGILLDPSCSASGVVTRVDVALMHQKARIKQQQQQQQPEQAGRPSRSRKDTIHTGDEDAEDENDAVDPSSSVNPEQQGNEFAVNEERVGKLAGLQRKLLAHALLSFDICRTVVYSTCSVHEAENEDVVRTVLGDSRVQQRGWQLSNIMPGVWKTRGIAREDDVGPLAYTIRCDPAVDATNGFYVARFDRQLPSMAEKE